MDRDELRKSVSVITIMLVVQFLLGMFLAVYLTSAPSLSLLDPVTWIIFAHIILGFALLGFSVRLWFVAKGFKEPLIAKALLGGLVSIGIAFIGGITFVVTSSSNFAYAWVFSYIMAIAFVFAVISYTFLIGILNVSRSRSGDKQG
jgi:hypothetical protein